MPKYHFHCTDGKRELRDDQGFEAKGIDEIYAHATHVARAVMARNPAADWTNWMVDVCDDGENVIAMVSFLTALRSGTDERGRVAAQR